MKRCEKRRGWFVRKHVAQRVYDRKLYFNRTRLKRHQNSINAQYLTESPPDIAAEPQTGGLSRGRLGRNSRNRCRLGTLNVNSVRGKQHGLRHALEQYHVGCLALQETLLRSEDWGLFVNGYHCFSVCGGRGESQRGVAMLVRKDIRGYTVGESSPWFIFVRCFSVSCPRPWIVGSVYIPTRQAGQRRPIALLQRQLGRLAEKYPSDSIVVMGDWNNRKAKVEKLMAKNGLGFQALCPINNWGPWRKNGRRVGRIDHIVVKPAVGVKVKTPRVKLRVDLSDHPMITSDLICAADGGGPNGGVATPDEVQQPQGKAIDTRKLPIPGTAKYRAPDSKDRRIHEQIACSNRWDPLLELASTDVGEMEETERQAVGDTLAEEFIAVSHDLAEDHHLTKSPRGGRPPAMRPEIVRAIRKRGKLYREAGRTRPGTTQSKEAWVKYEEAKERAQVLVKRDGRRRWTKALEKTCAQMTENPREFWQWTSRTANWRQKDSGVGAAQPVKDPDTGYLQTQEGDIRRAWKKHYEGLAADVTGHSRDPAWWERWRQAPHREPLEELNRPITVEEVVGALRRLKRNKAPGSDGIPSDFLKLAVQEEGMGKMGRAIHKVVAFMWEHGVIPGAWRDSTVVSIPKKGDVTDMNNYRGISLMGTILKVLMVVISGRLNETFEAKGLFARAQAGFRTREECVTQAACLLEITKRRKEAGRPTYLLFVDLKKAYDTVPHEALMAKLYHYGVRGRLLALLESLYANSTIRIRSGGKLTEEVALRRGLRQGCPLSPTLFNIFVNDFSEGVSGGGVRIPQAKASGRISALLFADDVVFLAPTTRALERMTQHTTTWTSENEMKAGIKKCGIMVVGKPTRKLTRNASRYQISGERVPIVEEYTYLGINFRADLQVKEMMRDRFESSKALVQRLQPFLRYGAIPMPIKMAVVRSVVIPRLLFGAELYGMNKALTSRMQTFLNRALRMVVGMGPNSTVSSVALWKETGIAPICAIAAARRARALRKCYTLKTWVKTLAHSPFKHRKWTWMTGTVKWMRRYILKLMIEMPEAEQDLGLGEPGGWMEVDPKTLSRKIAAVVWKREEGIRPSTAGDRYLEGRFEKQRLTDIRAGGCPVLSFGLAYLVRCRLGGFRGAGWLARRDLIPTTYRTRCPCCGERGEEDLSHLMLGCARWVLERSTYLAAVIRQTDDVVGSTSVDLFKEERLTLLLGGEINGRRLTEWAMDPRNPGSFALSGEELVFDPEDEDTMPIPGLPDVRAQECGCLRVARFLSVVVRARALIMRTI